MVTLATSHLHQWTHFQGKETLSFLTSLHAAVDKNSKETGAVISNCAKYTETGLKVVSSLIEKTKAPELGEMHEELQNLGTVLVYHMKYLYQDYAAPVVGGTSGPKTKRLFKDRGISDSPWNNPKLVGRVEKAAKLASIPRDEREGRKRLRGNLEGLGDQVSGAAVDLFKRLWKRISRKQRCYACF